MQKTKIKYYPKANTVHIACSISEIYPQYLKYVFDYLRIPKNAKIIFKDKTINGGLEEWLKT